MKQLFIALLLLSLQACHIIGRSKHILYTIENNSGQTIMDVQLYTSEKVVVIAYDSIRNHFKKVGNLSLKENKTDGDYVLEFIRNNGEVVKSNGGYYTNGNAMDRWVKFDVQPDTVLVSFSGMP